MQQPLTSAFHSSAIQEEDITEILRPSSPCPPLVTRREPLCSGSSSPTSSSADHDWVSVLERAINDELASDDFSDEDDNEFSADGGHIRADNLFSQPSSKPRLPSLTVPITPIRIPPHHEDDEDEDEYQTSGDQSSSDDDMEIDVETPSESSEDWVSNNHGLSRRALAQRKKFWNFRAEEWHRIETEQRLGIPSPQSDDTDHDHEQAYDAFFDWSSSPPSSPTSPTSPSSLYPLSSPPSPTSSTQSDSPTTPAIPNPWLIPQVPIYPRMGHLPDIHDDRASLMDQAFNALSLHTISKILYLHDMLKRSPSPLRNQDDTLEEPSEERSLSPVSSNDDTLVDEDVSGDGTKDGDEAREWETDWCARWQILARKFNIEEMIEELEAERQRREELAKMMRFHDRDEGEDEMQTVDMVVDEEERDKEVPIRPPSRLFFLPEEQDDDYDFNDDDDDDEDYGRLLPRSTLAPTHCLWEDIKFDES